ncbi:MAG TPA: twin-arginine translocation signal domain-containing protein, partial [Acidimicrobiales bacterium]
MCDACEHPPASLAPDGHAPDRHDADRPVIGRRHLLQRAGIGGVAVAAAVLVPDVIADAVGPPFESIQLGEDRLAAVVPAAVPAALPAAAPSTKKRSSPPAGLGPPAIVTRAEWGAEESIRTSERGFAPIRKFVVHHTASRNNP